MKIVVCIKQVPSSQEGRMDPETGVLIRDGATRLNPFDLFALEMGLQLREQLGGEVIAVTMGPAAATAVLREAFALGVDRGLLLTDRAFAGADVLATSYTLAQGIATLGAVDLVLCGRQTTDGDTAQVGPALAGQLGWPVAGWVSRLVAADSESVQLVQTLTDGLCESTLGYPCVLCVEQDAVQPRLPSLKLKLAAAKKEIVQLALSDLQGCVEDRCGLRGSPTQVKRIFLPEQTAVGQLLQGEPVELAAQVAGLLKSCLGEVHHGTG